MKALAKIALTAMCCLPAAMAAAQTATVGSAPVIKNWAAPSYKMFSQTLVDETMAQHPELLSLTLQGEPPGHKGINTMFAGSFPERIGKMSADVDVQVIAKGYTILDPRWNRDESPRKSVYLLPLRDKAGQNIGLSVIVFKNPVGTNKSEKDFFLQASAIRDDLATRIANHAALFAPTQSR